MNSPSVPEVLPRSTTKTLDAFKSVLTLFAHEKSSSLIETFPRSGSTVILSNLALSNLNLHTDYKSNNVNRIRDKLCPKRELSLYKNKALLIRSPITRLESFFLTKLVAGEPKSVVAVGALVHKCLKPYPIHLFKKLKGFFLYQENLDPRKFKIDEIKDPKIWNALYEIKSMIQKLTFEDMLTLFTKYGLPRDSHVYPQFHMKSFRLTEYSEIFNLNNFNSFVNWYNSITGENFSTEFNKTQPNNRLALQKFKGKPQMTVQELQRYLHENMTPVPQSIMSTNSIKAIKVMFPQDYDLHILSSSEQ